MNKMNRSLVRAYQRLASMLAAATTALAILSAWVSPFVHDGGTADLGRDYALAQALPIAHGPATAPSPAHPADGDATRMEPAHELPDTLAEH